MKVKNIKLMQRLDPEDIRDAPGTAERELKRKRLIKSFLWWASGEKQRWNSQNNEERIIVKRQFAYWRMLAIFGLFSNFAVYNCFLTGIYNVRNTELLQMRRVPFPLKIAASSALAYYMCSKLWDNNIYEAELYEVALKYRDKYDKTVMLPAHSAAAESGKESAETSKSLQVV